MVLHVGGVRCAGTAPSDDYRAQTWMPSHQTRGLTSGPSRAGTAYSDDRRASSRLGPETNGMGFPRYEKAANRAGPHLQRPRQNGWRVPFCTTTVAGRQPTTSSHSSRLRIATLPRETTPKSCRVGPVHAGFVPSSTVHPGRGSGGKNHVESGGVTRYDEAEPPTGGKGRPGAPGISTAFGLGWAGAHQHPEEGELSPGRDGHPTSFSVLRRNKQARPSASWGGDYLA